MTPRFLAIAAGIALLTGTTAAEAGITAVFGGTVPALAVTAAVCPAPAGALDRLERLVALDVAR